MQHGRDHDERRFHHLGSTTRRRDDEEEHPLPLEPAPAAKLADTEFEASLADGQPSALIVDALYERLAAEQAGIELIDLVAARGSLTEHAPSMRRDKENHAQALEATLRRLGLHPRFDATPSWDVAWQVLRPFLELIRTETAPRRILVALLQTEVLGLAAWELLEDLCRRADADAGLLAYLRTVVAREREHIQIVRGAVEQRFTAELGH